MKKKILLIGLIVLIIGITGTADATMFTGTSGNLSASADFSVNGSNLVVTLANISSANVLAPADVLTAVFFTLPGGSYAPVSALLPVGSTVFFGSNGAGNVGGEWAYASGLSGAPGGADQGISSSGFGLFGGANFGGSNLQGPAAVDGVQYGLTSKGDDTTSGNAAVTGGNALIQYSVVFTLSGISSDFDPSSITKVSFQYGTALTEPNVPGKVVPEPGTLVLLGSGLLGLALFGRKKFRK